MRQLLILLLILGFLAFPASARAQDASVYSVADVAVTADSAAHARDQAVTKAQRAAFGQLLERLGVEASVGAKLSDDDIATLVQHFELQSERSSSVRYLGTFTVQFRPSAVKAYLGGKGANFTEQRSPPIVVLPIYETNHRPILWKDTTRWRAAWDAVPHAAGLVPVILPAGGLDDISVISTEEAVAGTTDSIKGLVEKYQAGGAAVVTLKGNVDKPSGTLAVEIERFTADGSSLPTESMVFAFADKNGIDAALVEGVKKVIHQLEMDWKHDAAGGDPAAQSQTQSQTQPQQDVSIQSQLPGMGGALEAPTDTLPVTVAIATLAQWAQIQRKISMTPGVDHLNVVSLQRGAVEIEILFHGGIEGIQNALLSRNLQLRQDTMTGTWVINSF